MACAVITLSLIAYVATVHASACTMPADIYRVFASLLSCLPLYINNAHKLLRRDDVTRHIFIPQVLTPSHSADLGISAAKNLQRVVFGSSPLGIPDVQMPLLLLSGSARPCWCMCITAAAPVPCVDGLSPQGHVALL